jgi:N-acetylglucosamine malate deacetylase 1
MAVGNPFRDLVEGYARLLHDGDRVRVEAASVRPAATIGGDRSALIFAPHPDDESLTGALALRLLRQLRMRVLVVPVTLGSRLDRRAERLSELHDACAWLGFQVADTGRDGFGTITPGVRENDRRAWAAAVEAAAEILAEHRPAVVFAPHAGDRHPAHMGTHYLVLDALALLPATFRSRLVESEYWAPMADPNLMVGSSVEDVADLVAAVSLHWGEVARIPYHLTLPAWMIDNVRRGTELIAGFRAEAPACAFATLYRQSTWRDGRLQPLAGGMILPVDALPEFAARQF